MGNKREGGKDGGEKEGRRERRWGIRGKGWGGRKRGKRREGKDGGEKEGRGGRGGNVIPAQTSRRHLPFLARA